MAIALGVCKGRLLFAAHQEWYYESFTVIVTNGMSSATHPKLNKRLVTLNEMHRAHSRSLLVLLDLVI
jgi:hypothetical protein